MNDKSLGIVLKQTDAKDNDIILTVTTRDFGTLSLYARGLKKSTSRNAYACQLFDLSEFLFDYNGNRDIQLLKSASIKKEYAGIKSDYERLAIASAVLEITDRLDDDSLFELLFQTLELLENSEEMYTVFNIFLAQIFKIIGIEPAVDNCVICGSEKDIETISLNDGGFVCRSCNRNLNLKKMDVDFLRHFRIVNKASYQVIDRAMNIGLNDWKLTETMMEFLMMHSGLKLRSWRSLASLHN